MSKFVYREEKNNGNNKKKEFIYKHANGNKINDKKTLDYIKSYQSFLVKTYISF